MQPIQQLFSSAIGLLPEGGQRTARRNAWAAMSEDVRRARDRREAAGVFNNQDGMRGTGGRPSNGPGRVR
jgi:hypothetical protein